MRFALQPGNAGNRALAGAGCHARSYLRRLPARSGLEGRDSTGPRNSGSATACHFPLTHETDPAPVQCT